MDLAAFTIDNTPPFSLEGRESIARLLDVHDGDTVTVAFEVFPACVYKLNIRLLGIDAPEITSKIPATRTLAERARMRVVSALAPGLQESVSLGPRPTRRTLTTALSSRVYEVFVCCRGMDKYGRVLATVSKERGGACVSEILLGEGLAKPYGGGSKTGLWTINENSTPDAPQNGTPDLDSKPV